MKRTCEEKQLCGGKLVMNKKTDKQKKVIELVINGIPVSFYDANNGNVISALSFLHSVIETLAGDNVELLSSGFISQTTIDKKDAKNLDASHFSNEELSLSSDCENKSKQSLYYGEKPFIYTAKLSANELVEFLHNEYVAAKNKVINAVSAAIKIDDVINAIHTLNNENIRRESIAHHPESSLYLETNQLPSEIIDILEALEHSKLRVDSLLGLALQKEEIQAVLNWHSLNTQ